MSEQNPNNGIIDEQDENNERKVSAVERDYIMFKKDKIKEAAKKGNYAKARREAVELKQYLGTENNEMPIDDSVQTFE